MNTENNIARVTVSFHGGHAKEHLIRMRELGESLIGVERIVAAGLRVLETGRLPKPRERTPYVIETTPRHGSIHIPVLIQENAFLLPLLQDLYLTGITEAIWKWLNGVMYKLGGRKREGDEHFRALERLLERSMEHSHLEKMSLIRLNAAARQAVYPVGRSCEFLGVANGQSGEESIIDLPMAQAIRSADKLEVGNTYRVRIQVDGLMHHNRQLKVLHPREPGRFITARVQDPTFHQTPNVYTDAVATNGLLDVLAKDALRRDGKIHTMYILDAWRAPDDGQGVLTQTV